MPRSTDSDTRIERIEFAKTRDGAQVFQVIKVVGGELREYWFPLEECEVARDEIVAALSIGEAPWLEWATVQYLVETLGPMVLGPTQPGLYEACFVLPNGQVIFPLATNPSLPVFLPSVDGSRSGLPIHEGDYAEWGGMARLTRGNPLLTMAIAFAFTGPVAALLGVDAPHIELVGSCSSFMFAVEDLVASIWRRSRVEDAGYAQSWDQPQNVLYRIAAERAHTIMVIDDAPRENRDGGADRQSENAGRDSHLLSASNKTNIGVGRATPIFSVSTNIAASRARRCGAVLRDRLIHIAVDDGQPWIADLHDYPNESAFLSALNRLVRRQSGYIAAFFIEILCDVLPHVDSFVPQLQGYRDSYLRMARDSFAAMGDHAMRHEAFATIFAAGAGILVSMIGGPLELSDLTDSVLACEAAAIKTANEGF
jgi:Domain of unknown function (DUF927)